MARRIEDANQFGLGLPEVVRMWRTPEDYRVPTTLPELSGVVALDFETKDPGIGRGEGSSWPLDEGFAVGCAFATDQSLLYCPIAHAAGNMDKDLFWRWLTAQAAKPDVTFVMANSPYDTGWQRRYGIRPLNAPVDVQAMGYLLDENRRSMSLNALAQDYLGEGKLSSSLKDAARELHVPDPMGNMDKLPAWTVAPYALQDAHLTLRLYHRLLPLMQADDLMRVHELERQSALVAVDMREAGVRVDLDRAAELRRDFIGKRDWALAFIKETTQIAMNPFENEAAAKALRVENARVVLGETEQGGESVARAVLEQIGSPVAKAILVARKFDKAVGTFIDGYLGKFTKRGRIHCELHPTRRANDNDSDDGAESGTTSGRFACSNPNLQNVSARDPDVAMVRSCFLPEEGTEWYSLDYSSQEPRLTVHFAHLTKQRGAAEMRQRFLDNPKTDLHGECAKLMGVPRGPAKTIFLGLAYGMAGAKLCTSLGLPTKKLELRSGRIIDVAGDEGQRLLDLHVASVPFIKGLFDLAQVRVKANGYIKTLSGRRIHFEKYPDGNYARIHKSLNALIQGSAADMMKYALVAFRREGIAPMLTIHDSAEFSLAAGDPQRQRALEIMETATPISLPTIVDSKSGPNWGALK